ncbi:radical sam domain heme biosynthesis protein [hydrocarbon metagenome]|uniref:Radical sam domain heme biosynthesis protein n=1 Tax=hydrocarbon metagenome TaxID=938273 RepID=A0A0W8EY95_9ZZZZ
MKKSAGLRFLRNYVSNRLAGSLKRPTYAYITPTSLCNSRCGYCDMWKNKASKELDTEEWKRIIDELREIGVVTVTLSGGEPFMRKDLFELASYAKSQGLITMVVTNLSLFKEEHREKIAESFDFFGISIDSTRSEIYEEIRGRDWLDRIKENVHTIMTGLAQVKADVIICGMVTITKRNADEIHDLLHMIFDELGMDTISFNVLDPGGGAMARDLAPTPEQVQYCRQVISDHKSSYPISNSTRFLSQLGNFEYRCNPWKCVQINSGGFLLSPCLFSSENPDLFPDGHTTDLSENTLSDAWREAQKIYSRYADCKLCNLGCVIESAWSTYDLDFIINDSFRGTMIPTMKRVRERNAGSHHR